MLLTTIFKVILYGSVVIGMGFLVRELLYIRRRSPPKVWQQLTMDAQSYKHSLMRIYADEALGEAFVIAGIPTRITAWQFKFYRDLFVVLLVVLVHIRFLFFTHAYPFKELTVLTIIYVLSLTKKPFMPIPILLSMAKKENQNKKNDDIITLFLHLMNDYQAETADHYQSLFAKLNEYRRFTKALRPDLDRLLFNFPLEGNRAFKVFGDRVGTKEGKTLSQIMEKINETNPEMAIDLLEKNYDTFLDFRRQRRKKKLKSYGYIGHGVVTITIVTIIYFLNVVTSVYKSMMLDALN